MDYNQTNITNSTNSTNNNFELLNTYIFTIKSLFYSHIEANY